jgi:hypothetical protein
MISQYDLADHVVTDKVEHERGFSAVEKKLQGEQFLDPPFISLFY